MTTRKALAAGDRFVLSRLIVEALQREAGNALNLSTLDLPWPIEPFGHVAEVEEASGTEEQMVEVVGGIEVVVTQMAPLTSRVLESADALRLIVCTRGAGQRQRRGRLRKRSPRLLCAGA
jgi:D-3-phosphoglycerate dehydrogenase / 2-oxoglutarate reductase